MEGGRSVEGGRREMEMSPPAWEGTEIGGPLGPVSLRAAVPDADICGGWMVSAEALRVSRAHLWSIRRLLLRPLRACLWQLG